MMMSVRMRWDRDWKWQWKSERKSRSSLETLGDSSNWLLKWCPCPTILRSSVIWIPYSPSLHLKEARFINNEEPNCTSDKSQMRKEARLNNSKEPNGRMRKEAKKKQSPMGKKRWFSRVFSRSIIISFWSFIRSFVCLSLIGERYNTLYS